MTLDLAQPLPHSHAGLDPALSLDERTRVEVTMQAAELLPRLGVANADAILEAEGREFVDWVVGLVAGARRDAVLDAVGDVEQLELSQAAIVELAAAHATFVEVAGQAVRLEQVRAIVRRGMTMSQSYDLANTLEGEVTAARQRLAGILGKYPELQQLMSPEVLSRSAELVRPDGSPIV